MPDSGPALDSKQKIAGVVLAAGASRRLGRPKQLIHFDGESLLRRTARLAVEAGCAPVFVVLGFDAERLEPELAGLAVTSLSNSQWEEGMGSSLRCGVRAVTEIRPKVDALLVLVCDQPHLTQGHLRNLLALRISGRPGIIASHYAGRAGVPAVFASEFFRQLEAVEGDRGAREVIERESTKVQAVEWPEGAFDLDRPEQLDALTGG